MKGAGSVIKIAACLLSFTVLFVGTPTYAADEVKPIHLRMQLIHSSGPIMGYHKSYSDEIRRNTGGRVIIDIFPSGAIVPTSQMAKAVSEGTLDMAFSYGGYHAGWIDLGNIESGLPMAWGNIDEAVRVHMVYGLDDLVRKEYDDKGIHWITPVLEIPFLLASKKPVRSIADMKKMKIRATAPIAAVLKTFGIATVYLPSEEFYTSLSTGVIDGVIYGAEGAYFGLKLQEVAPYTTDMKILNPMTSAIIINKKVYDKLPEDLKGIIDDTTKKVYGVAYFAYRTKLDMEVKKFFKRQPFSPQDVVKLTAAAQAEWDKEAKRSPMAAKGVEIMKTAARDEGRL